MKLFWSLVIISAFFGGTASSAVISVEKDGSGDFSIIQDAVDAAEPGDTIQIGPGRFTETSHFAYYNGATILTCIALDKSLTILGAGRNETFIGPETPKEKTEYGTGGLACRSTNLELILEDLTIIDCDGNSILYDMDAGGRLQLERVDVLNSYRAILLNGTINSHFSDCFFNVVGDGITGLYVQGLHASNCIINSLYGVCVNIHFPGSFNNGIIDCELSGGNIGISLVDCGSAQIENCNVSNMSHTGVYLDNATGVTLNNVIVCDVDAGLALTGNDDMVVTNSIFEGSTVSVAVLSPPLNHVFQNNHIIQNQGGWMVWVSPNYSGAPFFMDFTNNYWGTTDVDEISQGIYDGYDDDSRNIYIQFDPMADSPVSTTETTLGGIKAMFR